MNSLICTILVFFLFFFCKTDIAFYSHPPLAHPLAFPFLSSPPLFDPDPLPSLFLILASPVVAHFVAQVLSPGSPGEPQSNLSLSAREGPSVLCSGCVCVGESYMYPKVIHLRAS